MKNSDPVHKPSPCNDESGPQYLGSRDQIESLLGFCNVTEVSKEARAQISLQPQQQINSVLEETK